MEFTIQLHGRVFIMFFASFKSNGIYNTVAKLNNTETYLTHNENVSETIWKHILHIMKTSLKRYGNISYT